MNTPDNRPAAILARYPIHTADAASAHVIETLVDTIEPNPVQMAVVDYIGFGVLDATGNTVLVDEYTMPRVRYGMRSMAHVACYGFTIIALNRAAALAVASI